MSLYIHALKGRGFTATDDKTQPNHTIYNITELRYLSYLEYRKAIDKVIDNIFTNEVDQVGDIDGVQELIKKFSDRDFLVLRRATADDKIRFTQLLNNIGAQITAECLTNEQAIGLQHLFQKSTEGYELFERYEKFITHRPDALMQNWFDTFCVPIIVFEQSIS